MTNSESNSRSDIDKFWKIDNQECSEKGGEIFREARLQDCSGKPIKILREKDNQESLDVEMALAISKPKDEERNNKRSPVRETEEEITTGNESIKFFEKGCTNDHKTAFLSKSSNKKSIDGQYYEVAQNRKVGDRFIEHNYAENTTFHSNDGSDSDEDINVHGILQLNGKAACFDTKVQHQTSKLIIHINDLGQCWKMQHDLKMMEMELKREEIRADIEKRKIEAKNKKIEADILQKKLEAEMHESDLAAQDRARRENLEAQDRARRENLEAEERARRENQEAEERARRENLEAQDRARRENLEAQERARREDIAKTVITAVAGPSLLFLLTSRKSA